MKLTDEEIMDILVSIGPDTKRLPPGFRDFAHAIEAALIAKQGEQDGTFINEGTKEQEPTCKQDLQVPTVKECLTVQCWVTKSGQFSFEPQDERYWTLMVPAPSVNAQERISELEAQNAQWLEALKHIEELSVCKWSAGIARATIAAVEGKTK